MKTQNQNGARPLVWLAVVVVIGVIGVALWLHTKQSSARGELFATIDENGSQVTFRVHPDTIVVTNRSDEVAPETEAALAQFGLSGKSIVKIAVVAQARPPIIIPGIPQQTDTNTVSNQ